MAESRKVRRPWPKGLHARREHGVEGGKMTHAAGCSGHPAASWTGNLPAEFSPCAPRVSSASIPSGGPCAFSPFCWCCCPWPWPEPSFPCSIGNASCAWSRRNCWPPCARTGPSFGPGWKRAWKTSPSWPTRSRYAGGTETSLPGVSGDTCRPTAIFTPWSM